MKNQKIEILIIETLEDLKDLLDVKNINFIKADTILFGKNGYLNSLALVTLISELEEKIENQFGKSVILADEKAMSQHKSPFRTISSLATYIGTYLRDIPNE